MLKVYLESPLGDGEKKTYIRELLNLGWKREAEIQLESGYQCCINTELNSTKSPDQRGRKVQLPD